MRNYRRRRPSYRAHANNSFWLSFSDLMSALVLVFVLVLFYSVYQYTTTVDELYDSQVRLAQQTGDLTAKQAELDEKDKDLALASEELEASKVALTAQQKELLLAQQNNDDAQSLLAQQQEALNNALIQLEEQQDQLDNQVALMDEREAEFARQLQEMAGTQQQLEALVGVRARIIALLGQALADANISATVDQGGAIRIDESVMFDFNSSVLKDSGKAMLNDFMPVYFGVLFDEANASSVSEIMIEGHTDQVGSYTANLRLSQERALAVMNYIMSPENTSISQSMKDRFSEKVSAAGRSYTDPVLNEAGEIDEVASRRVVFKFRMKDDQMTESMSQILKGMSSITDDSAAQPEATPEPEAPVDVVDAPDENP